ncbi:FMN-dependent NADH-azoreductase [Caballeronia sordidicola]|uniref:FMN dependent NADH:quinone oxidoreductase n=1 Tax=Caballeronia sordidicola TaxID=196367 RepID=A0A242M5M6_CABSO|nr:NAD(P)H-dependent oxidoreductase [Caballeronia sordidicola]OTP66331.1 FMN-dependent NADH-azoreductase [Caballeronia sordidicola]
MRALLLNSSPHGEASHAYRLAREMVGTLGAHDQQITERDLVADPLPPIGRDYAAAVTSGNSQDAAFGWSERVIREVEDTDLLIITTPMHNFTVPAALKLWIDHIMRINRTFTSTPDGKVGLMRDRPTFVLVGSGGFHSGERARQPDFLTPYLRYALESIGIRSVNFVLMQGLVGGDVAVSKALLEARNALLMHAPFNTVASVSA